MKKIYMVVGCPGSGKSWVCDKLTNQFTYVKHDAFIGKDDNYVNEIVKAAANAKNNVLIESPFSMSQIIEPLKAMNFQITPVFIQEDHSVISDRYRARDNKEIPKGHLTRQNTYLQRAEESGAFQGTSEQVLNHLENIAKQE